MANEEIWKYLDGYENRYMVSNFGVAKSFCRYKNGVILKPSIDKDGYERVVLYDGQGSKKCVGIHQLVALCFVPNPLNLPMVMHLDENCLNNCADNLAWGTALENNRFPKRNQRLSKSLTGKKRSKEFLERQSAYMKWRFGGDKNPMYGKHHSEESKQKIREKVVGRKMTDAQRAKLKEKRVGKTPNHRCVICGGVVYNSIAECARHYNVNPCTMHAWLCGRNKMKRPWIDIGLAYYDK